MYLSLDDKPTRERVFAQSLRYHGYNITRRKRSLKYGQNYIIPSSQFEDSGGVDFWIKPAGRRTLVPIQITQFGVNLHKEHYVESEKLKAKEVAFHAKKRVNLKKQICNLANIVFILVRDFDGSRTNPEIAKMDIKALRFALER
jgi:hypothetical protein